MLAGLLLAGGALNDPLPVSAQDGRGRLQREAGIPLLKNVAPDVYDAHNQNWAVAQGPRGIIYVANSSGLLAYDGAAWRHIPVGAKRPGGEGRMARAMAFDSTGTLYVGIEAGFGYLRPDTAGRLAYVSLLDHIPREQRTFNSVWSVNATPEGVYFLTNERLFRWSDGRMTSWGLRDLEAAARRAGVAERLSPEYFFFSFDVRGRLYVHVSGLGLMRAEGDRLRLVPGGTRFAHEGIFTVLPYGANRLLIGAAETGLHLYDGVQAVPFRTEADTFLAENQLYGGVMLPGGRFALATRRGGVAIIDHSGRLLQVIDTGVGLRNDSVRDLFVDRQGALWLALNDGLSRVNVSLPLAHYGKYLGLRGQVTGMVRHRGRLYITTSLGVSVLHAAGAAGTRAAFERVAGTKEMAWDLLSTEEALLAATNDGVVAIRDERRVRSILQLPGAACFALYRPRHDSTRIYVGLVDGLALLRLEDGQWTSIGRIAGISSSIRTLAEDSTGTLWLGTSSRGVLRVDRLHRAPDGSLRAAVTRYAEGSGLPALPDLNVYAVRDRIVAATRRGLFRYDPVRDAFVPDTALYPRGELPARGVAALAESPDGAVWMLGVHRRFGDRRIVRAVFSTPDDTSRSGVRLGRLAHLPLSTIYMEPVGTVWFGGSDGLVRYAPVHRRSREEPSSSRLRRKTSFEALVRSVRTLGSDSLLFGGYRRAGAGVPLPRVPYEENALRFTYAAPVFGVSDATRYQVFLEGMDEGWSNWTRETRKDYTNLPPGRYRFRVRAADVHGRVSEAAVFSFVVLPPWYLTWWAHLTYVLIGIGVVYGLVRWRSAHLQRQARRLERTVAARTEEVRQQKEQLEGQARRLETFNRELERSNRVLRETMEEKTKLMDMATHDLKSPLTGIRGLAEVLLEKAPARSQQQEYLKLIRSSSHETLMLIEELLESTAAKQGRLELDMAPVEMGRLAEQLVAGFRPQAERKGQPLRLSVDTQPDIVHADEGRLREALSNLISNAIKYSPPGRPIDVRVQHRNGDVRFAVQDEGPGLSEEDRKRLFKPFQQLSARPTGGEPSSGLGLYIVKQLVELHGGRVWVESKPGAGSTFILALPAADGKEPAPVS